MVQDKPWLKDVFMVLLAALISVFLYFLVVFITWFSKGLILGLFVFFCYWYFKKPENERYFLWARFQQIFQTLKMFFPKK